MSPGPQYEAPIEKGQRRQYDKMTMVCTVCRGDMKVAVGQIQYTHKECRKERKRKWR